MIDGAKLWEDKVTEQEIVNGSMIVFTDGKHNANPGLTKENVKSAINNKNVFVAALEGANLDEITLRELVDNNDDRYLLANNISELGVVFLDIQAKVQREANSIYFITYKSPISVATTATMTILINGNSNVTSDFCINQNFSTEGF